MPAVCFYFQVHQPFRLRPFSYFNESPSLDYFDEKKNGDILRKVADKCYLPTNRLLLSLIRRFDGRFRVSFSITGVALEQMQRYAPEVVASFVDLAQTGCVEFIGETYYHSLSALYDPAEFREQAKRHQQLMRSLFGVTPTTFRNTELIYSDYIGSLVSSMGYRTMIAEGADDILGWRSPHFLYGHPSAPLTLLLKSYRLSDDIAFRFSNQGWSEFPLTAEKYAAWLHALGGNGETVNLFMDYETFGEHQWESTGIFQFLDALPAQVLKHPDWCFLTPSEVAARLRPVAPLSYPRVTSWADTERDISAWRGNQMQERALNEVMSFGSYLRAEGDATYLDVWRKLQTSDHFYYMCTKWFADGDVHAYFSPYTSPYEAFTNYMNVLRHFWRSVGSQRLSHVPDHQVA